MSTHKRNVEQLLHSTEFKKLVKHRWNVSLLLTGIMVCSYLGFLYLFAYQKDVLAPYIIEKYTLGLVLALGLIVLAWLLTGIYVYWANNKYNPEVERLIQKLKNQ